MKIVFLTHRRQANMIGFAMVELLIVIIVLGALAALLWPALAFSRAKSQAAQCLGNYKQLITAFKEYADSSGGNFPANETGDLTLLRPPVKPWVNGWENYENGTAGSDTNTQFLVSATYTSMGPFVGNPRVFRCPADRSRNFGLEGLPRVRSVSMNAAVGCSIFGGTAGIGNWLGGGWRIYSNESSILEPSPAGLFIFLDENPDSINDGAFSIETSGISDASATWISVASPLHLGSTSLAFADGHVDLHHWRDPQWKTVLDAPPTYKPGGPQTSQQTVVGINRTIDLRWLGEHTSARDAGSTNDPWPWTYVPGP